MKSATTKKTGPQLFFMMPFHLSWWVWLITAALLASGLSGYEAGYFAAIGLSVAQLLVFWVQEKRISAFPVQLRIAFALLLFVCLLPYMRWLFWLPTVGTFAMLIFGYCLLARTLYLLPWNRDEPITFDLLGRTFLSRPKLPSRDNDQTVSCAGGVCSIEAQVEMRSTNLTAEHA